MENNDISGTRVLSDDDSLRNFCKEMQLDKGIFYGGDTIPDNYHEQIYERLKEDEYGTKDAILEHLKEG